MTSNFSDFQKQLFLDIYKTTLSALIEGDRAHLGGRSNIDDEMLSDAAYTALQSVDYLTNDSGELCKPSEILHKRIGEVRFSETEN